MPLFEQRNGRGLHHPAELAALEWSSLSASQSVITAVNKKEVLDIQENKLLPEARNKIMNFIDILISKNSCHIFNEVIAIKKAVAEKKDTIRQYDLEQLYLSLQIIRKEMSLTSKSSDIIDARRFKDNWGLFIRGTGLLAGPPWESVQCNPIFLNDQNITSQERNTIEISLAYLNFYTSEVYLYAAPLAAISYGASPAINIIDYKDRKIQFYNMTNSELSGHVVPVKEPLRYRISSL